MINISENLIFNFYFLNVHISLSMQVLTMKFCISIVNIAIKGTVSQFFYLRPSSIFIKFRKNIQKNYVKSYPFFSIK